jgi:negative regulator of flagellin synthesis FlgM
VANKVDGFDNRAAQVRMDRRVRRAPGTTSAAPATTGDSSVKITDSARQLVALDAAIKELPVVDEAKVAELRNAIENGSYEVDGTRVADKLLKLDRELHDQARSLRIRYTMRGWSKYRSFSRIPR